MLISRHAEARGHFNFGWLDTYHTFSFSDYYDPKWMGFRDLRVINEDRVQPGEGFPTHAHRDMEIITYILAGELQHKDSMGNGSIIKPGEIQRMSAGQGVTHSEYNPSSSQPVHLLQIWILPEKNGLTPSYEQKAIPHFDKNGEWILLASPQGRDGSVTVHQNVELFMAKLKAGDSLPYHLKLNRHAWIQLAQGELEVNGALLRGGDGIAASEEKLLEVKALQDAEFLLFDLN